MDAQLENLPPSVNITPKTDGAVARPEIVNTPENALVNQVRGRIAERLSKSLFSLLSRDNLGKATAITQLAMVLTTGADEEVLKAISVWVNNPNIRTAASFASQEIGGHNNIIPLPGHVIEASGASTAPITPISDDYVNKAQEYINSHIAELQGNNQQRS